MSLTPRLDKLDRNYIINGNFDFWQRGTSATGLTGPGYAAADRFLIRGDTLGTSSMIRSTDVPSVYDSVQPLYSMQYSCTATASIAPAQLRALGYKMEGNDLRSIAGKTFTISFWVKSFQIGTFGFSIKNSGSTRAYHTTYTINNSNTWEYKTITISHSTIGTWNYDNSSGLELAWILAVGSTYQTSNFNTWTNDSNFMGPIEQPYFYSSTSNYFKLSQVMLIEGSNAATFTTAGGNYADELKLCQRYYEALVTESSDYPQVLLGIRGGTYYEFLWRFNTVKRSAPILYSNRSTTGLTSGTGIGQIYIYNYNAVGAVTWSAGTGSITATLSGLDERKMSIFITGTSLSGAASNVAVLDQLNGWILGSDAEL